MQLRLFSDTDIEGTQSGFQAVATEIDDAVEDRVIEKAPGANRFNRTILGAVASGKTLPVVANLIRQQALFDEIAEVAEVAEAEEEDDEEENSKWQLLKWIGNKRRFAHEIVSYFPTDYGTYYEPFLGGGAVWAALAPERAHVSDIFAPLMEIWQTLQSDPETLKRWYVDRWDLMMSGDKVEVYAEIKASYNSRPNGADLLFLSRSCYGGVVRFRQRDGYMSTPCGPHKPMLPKSFVRIVDAWHQITAGTTFACMDYVKAMQRAQEGDLIYCDPPYTCSQKILYGAQSFSVKKLFEEIQRCKGRGVKVALSIDGTKKSGNEICKVPIPEGLFEQEAQIDCGSSMLKRFQMDGRTMEEEAVADRLLLTY